MSERRADSTRVPALGPRGEGWVVLQSVLLVAVVACAVAGPHWPSAVEPALRIIGLVLEGLGGALALAARFALGTSFTVLPRPRPRATLRRHGVYARARHPVYGGLVLVGIGLSLHRSPLVFLPTALLAVVFLLKSMREEVWLSARFPEYREYRRETPRRFIPWIV